jgi:hypothetical protein
VMNKKVEWEYRCPDLFHQFQCSELSSLKSEPACGVRTEGDAYQCAGYSVATFPAAQKFLPAAIPRQCYGDDGTIIYRQTGDVMKL